MQFATRRSISYLYNLLRVAANHTHAICYAPAFHRHLCQALRASPSQPPALPSASPMPKRARASARPSELRIRQAAVAQGGAKCKFKTVVPAKEMNGVSWVLLGKNSYWINKHISGKSHDKVAKLEVLKFIDEAKPLLAAASAACADVVATAASEEEGVDPSESGSSPSENRGRARLGLSRNDALAMSRRPLRVKRGGAKAKTLSPANFTIRDMNLRAAKTTGRRLLIPLVFDSNGEEKNLTRLLNHLMERVAESPGDAVAEGAQTVEDVNVRWCQTKDTGAGVFELMWIDKNTRKRRYNKTLFKVPGTDALGTPLADVEIQRLKCSVRVAAEQFWNGADGSVRPRYT